MLAWMLWLLACGESLALAWLAGVVRAAGGGVVAAVLACVAVALAWRAALVLATCLLGGLGWPGWRSWLVESAAMTRAYLSMMVEPLRAARERATPDADGASSPTLVLVHGWCCNAGVWRPLRAAWRRLGGGPPRVVTVEPLLGDIERMVDSLSRQVSSSLAQRRPLLLVAHSLGGLVARRWLQREPAAAGAVVGLVTLGTPHSGTRLARFGLGRAARQMRPGSAWLAALPPPPRDCAVHCAWSGADSFIAPVGSARLAGAQAVELDGRGHFGLLRDPRLVALLAALLARPGHRDREALALPAAASGGVA